MNRHHYFADLPGLKQRLEQPLNELQRTLPWLTRQGLKRRLDEDGLHLDVVVLGVCAIPLAITGAVGWQVLRYTNLTDSFAGQLAHLVALIALFLSAQMFFLSARLYIDGQAPASEASLRTLYGLVLSDAAAAEYVHALLDGNESPRNIDMEIAASLAYQNGHTASKVLPGRVSVWTFWDWHYGISYTELATEHERCKDAGDGSVR